MGHGGDIVKERKISSWKEYLKETKGSFDALVWVWKNLISDFGKRTTKKRLVLSVVSTALFMFITWMMKWLVDFAYAENFRMAVYVLVGTAIVTVVAVILNYYVNAFGERIFADNFCQVDNKTAEMFFEKSLGQHIRENSSLSSGNLEKGKHKVANMLGNLLFVGQESLFNTVIPFAALWVLSPIIGLLSTFVLSVFIVWSIYLNRRAIVTCTPYDAEFRRINRHRFECFDKIERIKTSGKEKEEVKKLSRKTSRFNVAC